MGSSTLVNIIFLIIGILVGVGITWIVTPILGLDQELQIIAAVILAFFTFISLYFMKKGGGG